MKKLNSANKNPKNLLSYSLLLPLIILSIFVIWQYVSHLTTSALWLDELATLFFAEPESAIYFLANVLQDTSPPLYYILMLFWTKIFGTSDFMVRLPSLLFAIAAPIILIYYGRKLAGGLVAASIAAIFLLTMPGMAQYAIEARSYAMVIFFVTALILYSLYLLKLLDDGKILSRNQLFSFAILGLATSLTHYFGLLAFTVCGLYIFAISLKEKNDNMANLIATGIFSALFYSIWLGLTYLGVRHRLGQPDIFTGELLSQLKHLSRLALEDRRLAFAFIIPPILLILIKPKKAILKDHNIILPLLLLLFIPLQAKLISFAQPIMTPRNFLVIMPPLFMLSSYSLTKLTNKPIALLIAFGLSAYMAYLSPPRLNMIKGEMNLAADYIENISSCQDATIYVAPDLGRGLHHFRHYLTNQSINLITDMDGASPEITQEIMEQECPVVLWVMHFEPERHEQLIPGFGFNPEDLQRIDFNHAWIYVKKENNIESH